jgi:hypothetical protein
MKKVLISGLIAGVILSIVSYGGLYLSIQFFPELFLEYNYPLFQTDSDRDILFYTHALVLSLAMSALWQRFKELFNGNNLLRGLEFGLIYGFVALLPIMWITYSSLDITLITVTTWFMYGLLQATIAGIVFARFNP